GIKYIDYKDPEFLKKFLNEQGKILPRRITGRCTAKVYRYIAHRLVVEIHIRSYYYPIFSMHRYWGHLHELYLF
ncbi:30S ribosomal protein S18, partial [Dysgonomonas sp. 511]|nr:30S ribosomal protein S18 [Dysgonomonas sp. 511]